MVIEWGIVLLEICTYVYHGLTRKERILMRDESLCLLVAVIHETLCGKHIIIGKVRVLALKMKRFEQVLELVNTQVGLKETDETERVEIWGPFPRPPEGGSRFENGITIPIILERRMLISKSALWARRTASLAKLAKRVRASL